MKFTKKMKKGKNLKMEKFKHLKMQDFFNFIGSDKNN